MGGYCYFYLDKKKIKLVHIMNKLLKSRKYNTHLLCASSLVYLLAGLAVFNKNVYLAILLFAVTVFSVAYHNNFKNFNFKALDWTFGAILLFYVFYILKIQYDLNIIVFLSLLVSFRIIDHIFFKTKHYGMFSYSHSVWHVISGLAIILMVALA